MKSLSRVKKIRKVKAIRLTLKVIIALLIVGLFVFNPFVWWFFYKEVQAVKVCLVIISLLFMLLSINSKLERR